VTETFLPPFVQRLRIIHARKRTGKKYKLAGHFFRVQHVLQGVSPGISSAVSIFDMFQYSRLVII